MYILVYKYRYNKLPVILQNIFNSGMRQTEIFTRHGKLFSVERCYSHHGKYLSSNYCSKLWKTLPANKSNKHLYVH